MHERPLEPLSDTPYVTGPLATTDLHAGGVFFCVVYRDCLQFAAGGVVRRWCEVIDDSRPFDDEATELRATEMTGTYAVDERDNLRCVFSGLVLTGGACEEVPGMLAFHAWRSVPGLSHSLVYQRRVPS